jgi:molecular chaperone GrpE
MKENNKITESDQVESKENNSQNENKEEIQGLRSQLIRLKAEFDNYRKRVEKEKELRFSYGKQTVLMKLIDLVEIFNNAVEHTKDSKNLKEVVKGLKLIHKEFMSFIMKEGIKPIETTGLKFNPDLHEIVGFKQNNGDEEENIILQEVKPGYLCDDEVIRPAKVIVSKKEEETKESKT